MSPSRIVSLLAVVVMCSAPAVAAVLYVDSEAAGANDGTSWTDAFATIQPAVDAAAAGAGGDVWVRKGTYTGPVSSPVSDSFELRNANAVDVLGEEKHFGFRSFSRTLRSHLTVIYLTGPLNQTVPTLSLGNTTEADSYVTG